MHASSLTCLLIAIAAYSGLAQGRVQLTDWQTYSSLQSVRTASVDSRNRCWVGSTGGLFVLDFESGETSFYRNINALLNLDVSMVRCDTATKTLFVGSEDGSLAIVTEDGTFSNITDIRRATQYQRRGILDCVFAGDFVYLATQFGIVSFNRQARVFIETIDRIGPLQRNTAVNAITTFDGRIWAATDSGLVSAPLSSATLRQPSTWRYYTDADGAVVGAFRDVCVVNNQLYATSGNRLFRYEEGRFTTVVEASSSILSLSNANNVLSYATQTGVFDIDGNLVAQALHSIDGHVVLPVRGSDIVMFSAIFGVSRSKDGATTGVDINSPMARQFMSVAVDNASRVWVGSHNIGAQTGQGLSVFDGFQWYNMANEQAPTLRLGSAYSVSALHDGSVLVGTWGGGGYIFDDVPGKGNPRVITSEFFPVIGISADVNYILVAQAAQDRQGTIWIVNELAADRMLVSIGSSSSAAYRNCEDVRANQYRSIAIDNAGTKWLGSPAGRGLIAYNERGTPDNTADDVCQRISTTNSNLPDDVVTAVKTDNNGALWIGTARGVAVMAAPGSVTASTVPFVRRISVLGQVVVNDLTVDALNNKWIATPDGVFVLNEDGTDVLATITTSNSSLISNDVRSIAIDPRTGRAWFGTTDGLSSAQTQSLRPLESYNVRCYPQPYKPQSGLLTIDGLASDSDVKIMTPNGHLVAAIQTKGRQALWDGRDQNGALVPPGVYVVHSSSTSDQGSAVAKVAVTK